MNSVTVSPDSTATVDESRVSKTEIKLCTVDEVKGKLDLLFLEHYKEIARNKEIMKLKPNSPMYYATEKM